MSNESQLLDLVVKWEELRAAGQEVSLDALCRDCPELATELRERLGAMLKMNAVLDARPALHETSADQTQIFTELPPAADFARLHDRPVIPHYELLEELGRGGMGVVFKARQIALGRTVALKTILPSRAIREEAQRRFEQEAKAMALLQHPNIVQIHEIGQCGDCPFLVMEYVEGGNLSDMAGGKPQPPVKAAELVATLARAVQAAHQRGVIHRDLKPNNILMSSDGTPKICDFGLAKHFEQQDQTLTHQPLGTPSYMAPEQVQGGDMLGPAVDVYALGAILYELLTGRPPFLADNAIDTLQLVIRQEPVAPRRSQPKTPRDLETICLKCLAKDPRRRYASAEELADDLTRFLAGEPIHARPVGPIERSWRWCRTHPSTAATALVAAVALVCVLTLVLVYNRRLAQELDRTDAAHREVLAVDGRLHHSLTHAVAERIDGDLRELAAVPLTLAALLETQRGADAARLEKAMKDVLGRTPMIVGLCVAFEPREWRGDQEDFALYVFRKKKEIAVKQLVPPQYKPNYRQWQWYRVGKESSQGRWSEPYIDEGGAGTPMVTFSAPIHRDGRFVGVVTADLAMDYFRNLRDHIDRVDLGPKSFCVVVSAGLRILSHPLDRYEFPGPDSDLSRVPVDDDFRRLMSQWGHAASGEARAMDFSTGEPASFLFSRIPSANWTLLTVIHE